MYTYITHVVLACCSSLVQTATNTIHDNEEEDHSSNSRWSHLPNDILEMIMKRLNLIDYLRMRATCSRWRATLTKAIANKHFHPLPELPLLLLNSQKKSMSPSFKFFNISTERVCFLKRPLPQRHRRCHGTVEGWLILSEDNIRKGSIVILFLNPVTNAVVKVPSQLKLPSKSPIPDISDLYVGKMVASSNPNCSNCVLVGLFTDYCHITFCRLSDKSWTMIEADKKTGNFVDVEIFDGYKLYVRTDKLNSILIYDLQHSSYDDPPKPKFSYIPGVSSLPIVSVRINLQIYVQDNVFCFLTKDDASGELLVIHLYYNAAYEHENVGYMKVIKQYLSPPQITKGEVFKLHTSNETQNWEKVNSLGDRVLFIGHCTCFVMSREVLNNNEELIAEDSIYFTLPDLCPSKPNGGTQMGRLCLTDNSVKYFSMADSKVDAEPFWFIPSAW